MGIPTLTRAYLVWQRIFTGEGTLAAIRAQLIGWDTNNTEAIKIATDSSGNLISHAANYTEKRAYSGSDLQYRGLAAPGTAVDTAGWQIQKWTWDGNKLTDIQWADGDAKFDKKWTLRATGGYIYS